MMALQLLPLLQLIIIFYLPGGSTYPNPIYGTKRYGRSLPYDPYPAAVTSQRYPGVNYYKVYPYGQTYPAAEEYYYNLPQETGYYGPPLRTGGKLQEYYQGGVGPYYYQDGYYGSPDWREEMLQEEEREEREESQPIGHESFYENDEGADDPSLADANAAFLQNLILSQMYQDSVDVNQEDDPYEEPEEEPMNNVRYPQQPDDEDVRELKQLRKTDRVGSGGGQFRKTQNRNKNKGNIGSDHWATRQTDLGGKKQRQRLHRPEEEKRSSNNLPSGVSIFSDRKPVVKEATATTTTSSSSTADDPSSSRKMRIDARGGQKEEFQMRPATPVRHPFAGPVLQMMADGDDDGETRKRAPSVYDTIKHMLDMEKSFENSPLKEELRPSMKKRIITPEENLTRQLTVLKKAAQ